MDAGQPPTPTQFLDGRAALALDELIQAIRWQRPCIVLAVYRSEFVRLRLQSRLEAALMQQGQRTATITVDPVRYDLPLLLSAEPLRAGTVFFASGMQWGGGRGRRNAYRALNLHRETLVENRLRVILWLTQSEGASLPRYAPDFWAFRHHVSEFLELPLPDDFFPAGVQPLEGDPSRTMDAAHGAVRGDPASSSTWLALAEIQSRLGCYEEARDSFRRAARLDPGGKAAWSGLARLYAHWGQPRLAARYRRRAG